MICQTAWHFSFLFLCLSSLCHMNLRATGKMSSVCFAEQHRRNSTFSHVSADVANDLSTAGAVASAGADNVLTVCFAEHGQDGTFSQVSADVANDPSTAGAAASAGADNVYGDTLPNQQPSARVVAIDAGQVSHHNVSKYLSTAEAAGSANADNAYGDTLPNQQPSARVVAIDAGQVSPCHAVCCHAVHIP